MCCIASSRADMLALRRSKNAYVDAPYSLVAGLKTESRQNFTNTGRNGPRVKTKTVLKPVNQVAKLGSMQNNDF